MSQPTKGWVQLPSLPINFTNAAITLVNSSEFLIAQYINNNESELSKIYKFNHHSSKLESYMDYPKHIVSRNHSITYDKITNKLYLYGTTDDMIIIDIKTKQFEIISSCAADCESVPCLLNIKGITHLIGGMKNSKHFILNNDSKALQQIHDFRIDEYPEIGHGTAIYISSKDIIVLIGGLYCDESNKTISTGIWIFQLKSKKWKQIKKKCRWMIGRAIKTSNEKYIIIAAADDDNSGNKIFILEIKEDTMILKKSNICSPKEGYHHMVRTGNALKDEMLVIGYIKGLFNRNDFNDLALPPFYIMQLIAKWYNMESIHWLEWNIDGKENDHYIIGIKRILSSIDYNTKQETLQY